jgi:hypothetical protein
MIDVAVSEPGQTRAARNASMLARVTQDHQLEPNLIGAMDTFAEMLGSARRGPDREEAERRTRSQARADRQLLVEWIIAEAVAELDQLSAAVLETRERFEKRAWATSESEAFLQQVNRFAHAPPPRPATSLYGHSPVAANAPPPCAPSDAVEALAA